MTVIVTKPNEEDMRKEVKAMRAASAKLLKSRETARDYLYKKGYISKTGKLTKRYGG